MKSTRIPRNLGNKYFLIFSTMTVLLFVIIIILQVFITQYLIQKNENDYLIDKLEKNKSILQNYIDYQKYVTLNSVLQVKSHKNLTDLYPNLEDSTKTMKIYYIKEAEREEYINNWPWLNNLSETLKASLDNSVTHLYAVDYPVVYSVSYVIIEENHLKNVLLTISRLDERNLGEYENLYVLEKKDFKQSDIPEWLKIFLHNNTDSEIKENYRYFYYNRETAYYFTQLNDFSDSYTVLAVRHFDREINIFFTQAFSIVTVMLFISLIVLIFAFGKWFSGEMIKPIKHLAEEMQLVAENPSKIKLFNEKEQGELQQIIKAYNQMATSLKDYQFFLIQYKTLFDQSRLGLFWLDDSLNIKLYNTEFCRIFEVIIDNNTQSEINLMELCTLDPSIFVKKDGYTYADLEMWLEDLKKYVSISVQCLEIDKRLIFLGMIADVSKQRDLQESKRSLEMELIKINRLAELGKRIQGIVHNLNSPLNSVLGYTQLLRDEYPENKDIPKIIEASKTMSQMIKSLLTKIKKDSYANPDLLDINEFIRKEIDNCKHHLFFKNEVQLVTNLQEDLPKVFCTYGDLSQIFNILFNNAIDAMLYSKEKKLEISSFMDDNELGFEIKDSGSGISKDYIDRIFEANFSTKEMTFSGGFGLGLAIAESIIKKMQGSITVRTEIDRGSTFRVNLPLNQTQGMDV